MNKLTKFKRAAAQKLTSFKLPAQKFFQDLVLLAGLGLVCFGIARIYRPAGTIAAGILLCVLSLTPGKKEK